MSQGGVEVRGLWEAFRPGKRRRLPWLGDLHWALREIDLVVGPGEMVGLIGRNGSGKSTLLQVMAGVFLPTRGSVVTSGRVVCLIDLAAGFHRDLSGRENLYIGGVLLGLSRAEVRARYEEAEAFSELGAEVLAEPLCTYSSGMVLRLAVGLLSCCRPSVVLVDEVLAVGDEAFQAKCLSWMRALMAAGGAVVLASHDLGLVAEHCDRVALLDAGSLVELGAPGEVIESYHRLIAVN